MLLPQYSSSTFFSIANLSWLKAQGVSEPVLLHLKPEGDSLSGSKGRNY
jgi:hypothetical protein